MQQRPSNAKTVKPIMTHSNTAPQPLGLRSLRHFILRVISIL